MAKTSFTSSSKAARALAWAGLLVLGVNTVLAMRLPELMRDTSAGDFITLERQVAAYPDKERVRVLVFGNSHAQAGFRIPILAASLGVPPEACFSLAISSESAEELEMLLPRLLPQFPSARIALCGIDPIFFSREDDVRLRYLTRSHFPDRWAYAMRHADPEERLHLVLGWALPLLDLGGPLWSRFTASPRLMARRLVEDLPPLRVEASRLAARPYPWGVPPAWDYLSPEKLAALKDKQTPLAVQVLAPRLAGETAARDRGFKAFARTLQRLEARGIAPVLVEIPLEQRMVGVLSRRPHEAQFRDHQTRLSRLPVLRPAPKGWDRTWFMDENHLTIAGAERLTRWVAAHLPEVRRAR